MSVKRVIAAVFCLAVIAAGVFYLRSSSGSSTETSNAARSRFEQSPADVFAHGETPTDAGHSPRLDKQPHLPVAQYSVEYDDKGHADVKQRKMVRGYWESFVREANVDAEQQQKLLQILSDMQAQYVAYEQGINEAMNEASEEAIRTHNPQKIKDEVSVLKLRDFDKSVEAELRSRVRKVLNPTQYGLFRRWTLDRAVTLAWGVYQRPTRSE